jgi:DNA (cytosine-5)-methyltransferase 1
MQKGIGEMNELALFAGAGGGILGGKLLGWRTVCAVEWEKYPASVLLARQNDGILPPFPIWDDVQTFDGKPWRGIVDVVSGGFPCQDISSAGKGAGIDGERSGMWSEMARIISEIRPKYTFIENSPMLTSRGLERVLADLAKMGFDAEWGVLSAADIGANHQRERIWIVGQNTKQHRFFSHTEHDRDGWGKQQSESLKEKISGNSIGELANSNLCGHLHGQHEINSTKSGFDALCEPKSSGADVADSNSRVRGRWRAVGASGENLGGRLHITKAEQTQYDLWSKTFRCSFVRGEKEPKFNWWEIEPKLDRVVDGMADRVDRLKAIGNGQVPLCAATAWELLIERLANRN